MKFFQKLYYRFCDWWYSWIDIACYRDMQDDDEYWEHKLKEEK